MWESRSIFAALNSQLFSPTSLTALFSCMACVGSAAMKIPIYSNTRSTRQNFRRTVPIEAIIRTPRRKRLYAELQTILAEDLPSIDLWYLDNVLVHNKRVRNLQLNPAGNYDFLRTAELAP